MSVLSQEEVNLLNKFSDSQPALNKVGLPLEKSGIKIGDALALAGSSVAVKLSWSFDVQGGAAATYVLGKIPAGSIVKSVIVDELVATDCAIDINVDGAAVVSALDLSLTSGLVAPTTVLSKASAGEVAIVLLDAATAGKVDIILECLVP